MAKRQVISCPWQDEQGNALDLGKIVFEASGDALVTGTGELCAGIKGSLTLDNTGSVASSPAQYMWPTDQMSPSNITYTVWVYSANGQLAWGPNYGLTVPSGAGPFNLCTWVPNQIGAGSGASAGSLTLQVEGVNNAVQSLLNLESTDGSVTITDEGNGSVNFQVAGGNGPRTRGWHGWTAEGYANSYPTNGVGCVPVFLGGTNTNIVPTATETCMVGITTGASSTVLSILIYNACTSSLDSSFTLGILGLLEARIKLLGTTTTRVWIGAGNGMTSGNNFWKSDTPAEPTFAFRYSTAAGDSFWQCVVTDGTTQVTTPTTVAPDTHGHVFAIEFKSPNVLFYIDGVLVGTVSIATTALTTANVWNGFAFVDNVATSNNVGIGLAYYYWDTTP